MPNALTSTGITTATQAELVATFTAAFQSIYGSSINLASNTPDGQMMMIFIQAILDVQDLLAQSFSSFDPNQAIGSVLDQRVAINGITRNAGTYTVTNVTLVLSQPVNLYGLDQTAQPVFTVADNAGNQWQLQATQLGATAGTQVYAFQAANPGALYTIPNTITVPVTIVLGVTSINNPTTYTTLGVNEETDAALRIRRAQSVASASQGFYNGMLAAVEAVPGVTAAFVYENDTNSTNALGMGGHSIWVIVAGSGSSAAIGQAMYSKRNAGCGMKGSQSQAITQADGSTFTVYWDTVVAENLYVQFNAHSINGVNAPLTTAIANGLPSLLTPGVYGTVNINELATLVQEIDPNTLVTGAGFSASGSGPWTNTLTPTAQNYQFVLLTANISITVI